jgi:hypothetical protein
MRENGIASKTKKKFKLTTYSAHKRPVAANLIYEQRVFQA